MNKKLSKLLITVVIPLAVTVGVYFYLDNPKIFLCIILIHWAHNMEKHNPNV